MKLFFALIITVFANFGLAQDLTSVPTKKPYVCDFGTTQVEFLPVTGQDGTLLYSVKGLKELGSKSFQGRLLEYKVEDSKISFSTAQKFSEREWDMVSIDVNFSLREKTGTIKVNFFKTDMAYFHELTNCR